MSYNFSETADRIAELQRKTKEIEAAAAAKCEPLKDEIKVLEQELMLAMQDAGLSLIKGKSSEAKLGEELRIGFQDFEEFSKFAKRKDALHLFQRRISVAAYRELKESLGNKPIPGLSEFMQPKLNVKSA
jgi:hypothetical protein